MSGLVAVDSALVPLGSPVVASGAATVDIDLSAYAGGTYRRFVISATGITGSVGNAYMTADCKIGAGWLGGMYGTNLNGASPPAEEVSGNGIIVRHLSEVAGQVANFDAWVWASAADVAMMEVIGGSYSGYSGYIMNAIRAHLSAPAGGQLKAVRFALSAGNISGTFSLYGVKA